MKYSQLSGFKSKAGKLAHSGYAVRSPNILKSEEIVDYITECCKRAKVRLSYDLSYDGFPRDLCITECFGGHGCIILNPADKAFTDFMMSKVCGGDRDLSFLASPIDKYSLVYSGKKPKKLIVLPGTNLLSMVDFKQFTEAMKDPETMVKPHPLTTRWWVNELRLKFGKDRVLSKYDSGAELVAGAEEIWSSESSELGIYNKLRGKTVHTYKIENKNTGCYYSLYRHLDVLETLLSTPKSGIIFRGVDYKAQVDEFFSNYLACVEEWRLKNVK